MPITQDVQQAAKAQLQDASVLAKEAAQSRAFVYPIKGIFYLFSHPSLYRALGPILWKSTLLSAGVIVGMFAFTWLPQTVVLLFLGPLAPIGATLLVLSESAFLILFLGRVFIVGQAQEDLFDAILVAQGHQQLVSRGRSVSSTASGAKKLGKSVLSPLQRFSKAGIIRYLVSLPLNAIPVVGTALFVLYNGFKSGPSWHARYFQYKGLSGPEREKFVHERRGSYTAFGITTLVLDIVPIVGLVLSFTSTAGAALWAADLEQEGSSGAPNQVPVREQKVEL